MNITVHIERLILNDLPATTSQGPLVQAAVEAELMRLLGERGLSPASAGAVPHVSAGSIQLTDDSKPAQLGDQIAQAIHRGLTPTPAHPSVTSSSRGTRK